MGLALYSSPVETSLLDDENPFSITFDGRLGGSQSKCVYIHNNMTDRWYGDITLQAVDTSGTDIVDGTTSGWTWKLLEKDIPPAEHEWNDISAGNTITLSQSIGTSSIADIVSYIPVWVRVEIPRGQSVQNIVDVVLRLSAEEYFI